jgi:uncharacterized membrane protein
MPVLQDSASKSSKEMGQHKLQLTFGNALTGFIPGAFLLMAILLGFPLALSRDRRQIIQHISFKILVLELILLASGFTLMTLVLDPKYLTRARWRNVLAGVGAVMLLIVSSAFLQGAGWAAILLASISAGILSVLFALRRTRQV